MRNALCTRHLLFIYLLLKIKIKKKIYLKAQLPNKRQLIAIKKIIKKKNSALTLTLSNQYNFTLISCIFYYITLASCIFVQYMCLDESFCIYHEWRKKKKLVNIFFI